MFHALYRKLPYVWPHDDETVLLRDGSVMCAFEVRGLDAETADPFDIQQQCVALSDVLKDLNDRFSIYVHKYRRAVDIPALSEPAQDFAKDINEAWLRQRNDTQFMESIIVISLIRTSGAAVKVPFFSRAADKVLRKPIAERVRELRDLRTRIVEVVGRNVTHLTVSDGRFASAFSTLNFQPYRHNPRSVLGLLAEDVAHTDLDGTPDGTFEVDGGAGFGAVLSVKEMPIRTDPGLLDGLDMMDGVVTVHSYTPVERINVVDMVRLKLKQMASADEIAETIKAQLYETADDVEAGRVGVGEYQFNILVHAEDRATLDERVNAAAGICQNAGFKVVTERTFKESQLFACHPGNMDSRARSELQLSTTFAEFASFHSERTGYGLGEVPWNEPVTVLRNSRGGPYRFSFHPPGHPDEEDTNGHTLVLGPSDSGKTTTTLFLAAQALRLGGRVIAFDKDRAMRMFITALGGTYAEVKQGVPTGLNPLYTETDERGQAWFTSWFSALLESTGEDLTPKQSTALQSAIRQSAQAGPDLRRFEQFQTLFGDMGDGGNLALRVSEWGSGGRYGWVFDHNEDVLVDFKANDVTAIDLTEILSLKTERTAILAYLFRSIEVAMEEMRPTVLIVDEAWQVLDDPYFANYLKRWLVTVRKLKVVVVMMTQFPSQVRESAASTIFEALPNQILFPNRRATPESYEGFGLTESELAFLLSSSQGSREVLRRTKEYSTILDVNIGALGPLLTAIGGGKSGMETFGADYATREHFWREMRRDDIDTYRKAAE